MLVLSIINGPDYSNMLDKAKLFAMIFAFNSRLDDKGYHLPDFPSYGAQT